MQNPSVQNSSVDRVLAVAYIFTMNVVFNQHWPHKEMIMLAKFCIIALLLLVPISAHAAATCAVVLKAFGSQLADAVCTESDRRNCKPFGKSFVFVSIVFPMICAFAV